MSTCASCKTELPANSPGNRCPLCLFTLALDNSGEDGAADDLRPTIFGDYELIEEIARGGMGVVFKARQLGLNRIVALKLILSGQFAARKEVLRFRSEAEAAASLRHPNIVAIHETGEHHGQHYFSMEYIEGRDLAAIASSGPLAPKRAARYAELIARAIQHAHDRNILHRDLKPSNVLIDAEDEPRVTDFGLAKRLRSDFGMTVTGQTLGSPNYMPPEQTSGKSSALSPACDIYGIGAVLYHLLTGRPPFQAGTIEETVRMLHEKEIISPRLLNASVSIDLETICLKCLEKSPFRRYATAADLADELGRFLRDEPIRARPVGRAERLWRWCQRKPLTAGLSVAAALAIAMGIAGMVWQGRARARDLTQTRRLLYAADMNVAQQAWDAANTEVLRGLLHQQEPKSGAEDLRGFEWRLMSAWERDDDRLVLFPHEGANRIAYSPDGAFLASLSEYSGVRGQLRVWRTDNSHSPVPIAEFDRVQGMAFSPTGHMLAISLQDGGLQFWDLVSKRFSARLPEIPETRHVRFSADGLTLMAADRRGAVSIWKLPSGELHAAPKELGATRHATLSPDARHVATVGENGIRVWDLRTDRVREDIRCDPIGEMRSCEFSPDGRLLALLSDSQVCFWSVEDWTSAFTLKAGNRCARGAFSKDGTKLITCGWAGAMMWNLQSRAAGPIGRAPKNDLSDVSFAPRGNHVAMATARGALVEKLESKELFDKFDAGAPVKGLAFSPDSQILAIGTEGALILRSSVNGDLRFLLKNQSTYALAFSPDGGVLATGSDDNLVRLWDVAAGTSKATLPGHNGWVRAVAFSPDGRWLATSEDGNFHVCIWNAAGELQTTLTPRMSGGARTLCFSSDGKYMAIGARNGEVSLWSVGSWRQVATHNEHASLNPGSATIHGSLFLEESRTLVTADNQGWIAFWDTERQSPARLWQAHSSGIRTLALSVDGRTLVSGGYAQELVLWHVPTGRAMLRLKHPAPIFCTAFSRDGNVLATGDEDHTVRLWNALPAPPSK